MHDTRRGRSSELDHGRRPWRLNLVGESYEDDWQDCHRVGCRIFRVSFHGNARIGRQWGTSHRTAWPPLRVLYSSRHRLQFHKLCGVRGDGFRPKCLMLWQYPCRRSRSLEHSCPAILEEHSCPAILEEHSCPAILEEYSCPTILDEYSCPAILEAHFD